MIFVDDLEVIIWKVWHIRQLSHVRQLTNNFTINSQDIFRVEVDPEPTKQFFDILKARAARNSPRSVSSPLRHHFWWFSLLLHSYCDYDNNVLTLQAKVSCLGRSATAAAARPLVVNHLCTMSARWGWDASMQWCKVPLFGCNAKVGVAGDCNCKVKLKSSGAPEF